MSRTIFITDAIRRDNEAGTYGGRVQTRFPPEPNGFLHVGHAKAIVVDFGTAEDFGGTCMLRLDDTNPETEEEAFVNSIVEDIEWLGYEPSEVRHASDYFEALHDWAVQLDREGPGLRRRPGRRDHLGHPGVLQHPRHRIAVPQPQRRGEP